MKKILTVLLLATIITSLLTIPVFAEEKLLNIGDYILFGKYDKEEILWRCVGYDENGALMLADRIIMLKAYDATQYHDPDRTNASSNYWGNSDLRCWLNTREEADNIDWPFPFKPTEKRVTLHPYDAEKGFLHPDNFTDEEYSFIKEVTQKATLNVVDAGRIKEFGEEQYSFEKTNSITAEEIITGYDAAFGTNVTDRIFLLDLKQVLEVSAIFGDYIRTTPTDRAKKYFLRNNDYEYFYWTRTPCVAATKQSMTYSIPSNSTSLGYSQANNGEGGVRPAFYLDLEKAHPANGDGSKENPFTLEAGKAEPDGFLIRIDGTYLSTENEPVMINDRIMIPLRDVCEALQCEVGWIEETETATITKDSLLIEVQINNNIIKRDNNGAKDEIKIDVPATLLESRTYIPLRAVAECFGYEVSWNDIFQTAIINSVK